MFDPNDAAANPRFSLNAEFIMTPMPYKIILTDRLSLMFTYSYVPVKKLSLIQNSFNLKTGIFEIQSVLHMITVLLQ